MSVKHALQICEFTNPTCNLLGIVTSSKNRGRYSTMSMGLHNEMSDISYLYSLMRLFQKNFETSIF